MAIGMTYEQFWYGDPWMVVSFRKAHELKKDMLNQQMWLMGLYVNDAINSALSGFGKNPKKYMDKPLDLHPKTDAEKEREKAVSFFKAMEAAWRQKGATDGRQHSSGNSDQRDGESGS